MKKKLEEEKLFDKEMSQNLKVIYANANCTNCPTEWFFPENVRGKMPIYPGSNLHCAFSVCNECKVKTECFNFAKANSCIGVWGGRLFTFAGISKLNKNGEIK